MKIRNRILASILAVAMVTSTFMVPEMGYSVVEAAEIEQTAEEPNVDEAFDETENEDEDETADEELTQKQDVDESSNEQSVEQKAVSLTVGTDETSRNITWYCNTEEAGEIQYAVKNEESFPTEYMIVKASVKETSDEGFYSNQATLENLQADTEYVYRLVNGTTISEIYSFQTGNNDKNFNFLL